VIKNPFATNTYLSFPMVNLGAFILFVLVLLVLASCKGGGGGSPTPPTPDPSPGPSRDAGPDMTVMPPDTQPPVVLPGGGSESFPPEFRTTSSPQEAGSDIRGIEVAGLGTTTALIIRNTLGSQYTVRAGTWYEPKDGGAQRMIVTRTTSVPSGQTARVSAACMQREKATPAHGLRFFSQFKTIRAGGVQTCQQRCLSRDSDIQECVWNCQRSQGDGSPGVGGSRGITFRITDACNDGYDINYRFFAYDASDDVVGAWPGGRLVYSTRRLEETHTHRLACTSDTVEICYGAQRESSSRDNSYWGVGLDGDEGCADCCNSCPSSGVINAGGRRLTCE